MIQVDTTEIILVKWLATHNKGTTFPYPTVDYYERFLNIDKFMNENVHPAVNQGSAALDPNHVWLTDHSVPHIQTVMRRAGDLILAQNGECCLSPYETYLLLLAIHFHDVGNVTGRDQHEQKIGDILARLQEHNAELLGGRGIELRLIKDIATAHGGYVNGDIERGKDTIGLLDVRSDKDNSARPSVIAAILRFADELADDKSRVHSFVIDDIPDSSQVFHRYAFALEPIVVNLQDRKIIVNFDLDAESLTRKWGKGREQVYLFDEIIHRLLKMHKELIYCSRFISHLVPINQIEVSIDICNNRFMDVIRTFKLILRQQGYPDSPGNLCALCPELDGVTGESLKNELETDTQNRE